MNCENCGKVFYDEYDYCPECGQSAIEKLSLKVLFSETFGNYFSVDAKIFKSIYPLIFKPGFLAKEFVEGKRLQYLHPARFYLFVSVLFFFLYSFSESSLLNVDKDDDKMEQTKLEGEEEDEVEVEVDVNDEDEGEDLLLNNENESDSIRINGFFNGVLNLNRNLVDSMDRNNVSLDDKLAAIGYTGESKVDKYFYTQVYHIYSKKGDGLGQTFNRIVPISLFFMLPIFALILKLFHYKKGSYSKHLVFSFSYFTFIFTLLTILMLSSFLFDVSTGVYLVALLLIFLYLVLGIKKFYAQKTFRSLWKSMATATIFNIIVLPFYFLIMAIITFIIF